MEFFKGIRRAVLLKPGGEAANRREGPDVADDKKPRITAVQMAVNFVLSLPLLAALLLVSSVEAKIEQLKKACVEVEKVADQCARKHYAPYKLQQSKTQPYVKKCFSSRAHVTDLMLDCAEPMALGIFITCSVDAVVDTTGVNPKDPDFLKRTQAYKGCAEKNLQGTVPGETDPYEYDKRRRKQRVVRRQVQRSSADGLFSNAFLV